MTVDERGRVTRHNLMDGPMEVLPGGVPEGWTVTIHMPFGFEILGAAPEEFVLSKRRHVGSILPGPGGRHALHVFEISRGDLS